MQPEWIRVSPGEAVYMMSYMDDVARGFPHHGGTILSGERNYRHEFESRVRDFVCSDCTRTYTAYWEHRRH